MNTPPTTSLAILAGGQSTRIGTDKAVIRLDGERLIDILIRRFADKAEHIMLSARDDYGTGLPIIPDDPQAPGGPVGAIFSLADRLQAMGIDGFVTVPVDAPFAPADLIERLTASGGCAVAEDGRRMHPTLPIGAPPSSTRFGGPTTMRSGRLLCSGWPGNAERRR